MRFPSSFRALSRASVVTALPVLLLTPPLTADVFFWDAQAPNLTEWSNHLNWTGPEGDWPSSSSDSAFVSGNSGWDPKLDFNYQLGGLTLQLGGDASTGEGSAPGSLNFGLIVTSVNGGTGLTLIKDEGSSLDVYLSSNMNDLDTDDLLIRDGAALRIFDGAKIQVDDLLDLNPGATLIGEGSVEFTQDDGTHDPDNGGLIRSFGAGGTLRFFAAEFADPVFDLDGASDDGALVADNLTTLVFDLDVQTIFRGTMTIGQWAEIQISDTWALSGDAGSILTFNGGNGEAVLSSQGVNIFGTVNVNSGAARISAIATVGGSVSVVNLAANTTLEIDQFLYVDLDATVQGDGQLRVASGATMEVGGATMDVAVHSDGLTIINSDVAFGSFEQGDTGCCQFELCTPNLLDRLAVTGSATLAGQLDLGQLFNCQPDPGDEFTIITAASIKGKFAQVTSFVPVQIVYSPTSVTAVVTELCPADLDGDGAVDVADLILVISGWGGPGGDVNGDDVTNVLDLVAVIGAWGLCV